MVINAGTILCAATGIAGAGTYFRQGGILTNLATGLISGRGPVSFHNSVGTVDNSGTIISTAPTGTADSGSGVYLGFGGAITNNAGAQISAIRTAISALGRETTINNLVVHPLNCCDIWHGGDPGAARGAVPPSAAPEEGMLVLVPVRSGAPDGLFDLR